MRKSEWLGIACATGCVGLLLAFGACGGESNSGGPAHYVPHWGYEGATDSRHWGELNPDWSTCGSGKRQSPVDIAETTDADVPDLAVSYEPTPLRIQNNGHTIQIDCAAGSMLRVGGEAFELLQFHFHHPSEHTIRGAAFPLEVHFVHRNESGELAVLGVLVREGKENPALADVWANVPRRRQGPKEVEGVTIDTAAILPPLRPLFSYAGSLTTPPCTEGVHWFVLETPIEMSRAQIDAFASIFRLNARPVQPLGDRSIEHE